MSVVMEQADGTPKDGVADFFIYHFHHIWTTQVSFFLLSDLETFVTGSDLIMRFHGCFLCLILQNISSLRARNSPPHTHTVYLTFMICLLHFIRIVNIWKMERKDWIHSVPSGFCNPPPFLVFSDSF